MLDIRNSNPVDTGENTCNGETDRTSSLDLTMIASLRDCLASVLTNTTLDHVNDLRLTLPYTYDFVALGGCAVG
jgi:hypothetical protein